MFGDGYIGENPYEVAITENSLEDLKHIYKVKGIIKSLFGLDFKVKFDKNKNAVYLRCYSKPLVLFLNEKFNFPIGKKKGKLKVPFFIAQDCNYFKYFVRGLFDTDGSIYIRRKKNLVLEIISADFKFLEEIKHFLNTLNYNAGRSGKNLYIYKPLNIFRFFKEIKPYNDKHLKRYNLFKKVCTGRLVARNL